jgi:hypothetical protein
MYPLNIEKDEPSSPAKIVAELNCDAIKANHLAPQPTLIGFTLSTLDPSLVYTNLAPLVRVKDV